MHNVAAALFHLGSSVPDEDLGTDSSPTRIRWREVDANIAFGNGAEQRIGQRMQADVCVAVADELLCMRNADAAQHNSIART